MRKLHKVLPGVGLVAMATPAMAAIPADVTTAFTDLTTDAATFLTSVWGVLTIIVIGFLWMKLFRKGLNKAT
jgi:uncharacterized BrkB/YihY/UPF0761 family membrane protein